MSIDQIDTAIARCNADGLTPIEIATALDPQMRHGLGRPITESYVRAKLSALGMTVNRSHRFYCSSQNRYVLR